MFCVMIFFFIFVINKIKFKIMALLQKEKESLEQVFSDLNHAADLLDVDMEEVIEIKKIEQFVLIQEHLFEIACVLNDIKRQM